MRRGHSRSRSLVSFANAELLGQIFSAHCEQKHGKNFAGLSPDAIFSGTAPDVCEFEFSVAPRDVHCKGGIWVLNKKITKGAEVNLRSLNPEEYKQFLGAMDKEIDSYVSSEAVRICEDRGIDPCRIMQMRWVCAWKPDIDEDRKSVV